MVKVIIEEDGKVIRTISGDVVAGFIAKDSDGGQLGIDNTMFVRGTIVPRNFITSLSFFCIEVIDMLSGGSKTLKNMKMKEFKQDLGDAESGKISYKTISIERGEE